jgi:predicted RecB family nuclease
MLSISPKHIVAYSQCPMKAFLMLNSEVSFDSTEYENLLLKFQNKIFEVYHTKLNNVEDYKEGILKSGFEYIKDCNIHLSDFSFYCKLIIKNEGKSSLGKFFYEPVIFLGTNQIAKENRLELAFLAFLLEKIQNKFPDKGLVIDKKGNRHRVELAKLKKPIKTIISEIQDFEQTPPKLILNRHCQECPFEKHCKTQAQKEDNLSLLARITPKQINKLEKKGIFTIKQLSFIYKPRRRNKKVRNPPILYKPELQALAIRTTKTYIQRLPTLDRKPIELFLDIEGLPDEGFFYLFGILISDNGNQIYHSFWSDNQQDERNAWQNTIECINTYPESPIYHYGTFEPSTFEKLAKRYQTDIESIKIRFINTNSFIFGKIYFPTYSNGLKDLAKSLGMTWTNERASGLQSIIWRNEWEEGLEKRKEDLEIYNQEDCLALKMLTDELMRIQTDITISNDVDFIQTPKRTTSEVGKIVHDQFENILDFSHYDYDKRKVKLNFETNTKENKPFRDLPKIKKGFRGQRKYKPKVTRYSIIPKDDFCPKHEQHGLENSPKSSKRLIIDIAFTRSGAKKSIIEYIGEYGYCSLCKKHYPPNRIRQIPYSSLYGYNLKAWFIYQRIALQLSYEKIIRGINELFNEDMSWCYTPKFVKVFSLLYEETENIIVKKLLDSPYIHVDETPVNIQGITQYIWVFTNEKYVILRLSETREIEISRKFLENYKGTIITDFYAGYDSLDCNQQRCWVHFIRDLNDVLWNHPFDKEYEFFVSEVRNLIVPILQTVHKNGLKKYFLMKHQKEIDKFYFNHIDNKIYKSEHCNLYQKRFIRYRNSLFTFVNNDSINWHNNTAERGLRHICKQLSISGSLHKSLTPHYLRLVSIMQTCRFQNKSFLKFLLSKEKDIDNFGVRRKGSMEKE